jgi:hypothetical protein
MVGAIRDGHHSTARALEPFGRLSDGVKIFWMHLRNGNLTL